jgi:hypothetical protein
MLLSEADASFIGPDSDDDVGDSLAGAGDVNGDGTVNILDLTKIAVVFGKEKDDQDYDLDCDLNKDGVINIIDLTSAAINFGKSIPINPP